LGSISRRFLLRTKIPVLLGGLLVLLGTVGVFALDRALSAVVEEALAQEASVVLLDAPPPDGALAAPGELPRLILVGEDDRLLAFASGSGGAASLDWLPAGATAVEEPERAPEAFASGTVRLRDADGTDRVLRLGFDRELLDRLSRRVLMLMGTIMAVPFLLVLLGFWVVARQVSRPLARLARVADEISLGNFDPPIDMGARVNCWEIIGCQHAECRAYQTIAQPCWYLDGTPCEGYEPRFPEKLQGCRSCQVYRTHRGDEITQLADAFKHMISSVRESREALAKSDDFQRRVIRNSFDGIVATDADGTITIFNRMAEHMIGIPRESVIGIKSWTEYFRDEIQHSMDIPRSYEPVRRVRGFRPMESTVRREDGEMVDVLLSGISLFERGIPIGMVFFFQDLREIKRLRQDLIQSERLAAAGQAAAGISHSIKNILDGFRGGAYVYKLGKRKSDQAKMEQGWDMIERNVEIISNLVVDLLNFAKVRELEPREVDPADLISEAVTSAGLDDHARVEVRVEVDEPEVRVWLDPHAVGQCLVNLIRNAVEAVPPDRDGHVLCRFELRDGTAVFTVRDDGDGMSPATMEKIITGMHSTKGSKGTGLGLLVVQKVLHEHRGTLRFESAEGEGTTFQLEFPQSGIPAPA